MTVSKSSRCSLNRCSKLPRRLWTWGASWQAPPPTSTQVKFTSNLVTYWPKTTDLYLGKINEDVFWDRSPMNHKSPLKKKTLTFWLPDLSIYRLTPDLSIKVDPDLSGPLCQPFYWYQSLVRERKYLTAYMTNNLIKTQT